MIISAKIRIALNRITLFKPTRLVDQMKLFILSAIFSNYSFGSASFGLVKSVALKSFIGIR
jgi:hypothetical protein